MMAALLWMACTGGSAVDPSRTPTIDIGQFMTCALDPAQGFWCWGDEQYEIYQSDYIITNYPMHISRDIYLIGFQISEGATTVSEYGSIDSWWDKGTPHNIIESGGIRVEGSWEEDINGIFQSSSGDSPRINSVTAWSALLSLVCYQQGEDAIVCDHGDHRAPDVREWNLHRSSGRRFVWLNVGDGGVCGVDERGGMDCFGLPAFLDAQIPREEPRPFKRERRFQKVFTWGEGQGCALEADGTPTCWGTVPSFLTGPGWSDIAYNARQMILCAIRMDGEVACDRGPPFVPYPGVLPPQ